MTELTYILRSFLNADGKLTAFPAKRKMKIYALFYLAEKIEEDRDYTERQINDLLLSWHTFADPATLRRELYDYGFLLCTIRNSTMKCYITSTSAHYLNNAATLV